MKTDKQVVIGLLAHVDAGKTTLSEAMLYEAGSIRSLGRVDHQNTFLDTEDMERERGITIFSKQARLSLSHARLVLLDTPGHVDFSAEMERTLPLLDYAILVISGTDGVQAHTRTLWKLLKRYRIPVFLFVNKMDYGEVNKEALMQILKEELSDDCICFYAEDEETLDYEAIALCDEGVMDTYLKNGIVSEEQILELILNRKLFPCYFGSALKLTGVKQLLSGLDSYTKQPCYREEFAARVYKIGRDSKGERLTYMKLTGGSLSAREELVVSNALEDEGKLVKEKVNQIRLYSGVSYEVTDKVHAGQVCAVTGLSSTYAGQGLGAEEESYIPRLAPVLEYQLQLSEEVDARQLFGQLLKLSEEEPELSVRWEESQGAIYMKVMGQIQCDIVARQILERFGVSVSFGEGTILYKETIGTAVEGVGHYEPLKHYAEVHLLLEPGARGSGVQIDTVVSEDVLAKNWQRLILTHLQERKHKGVLIGAELTDVKLTLVAGKAHKKHTEGGDFRQATYRAVRQGLMQAQSVLLEPVYAFTLKLPKECLGRAMADINHMGGRFDSPEMDEEWAYMTGVAPVRGFWDYQTTVRQYTKGEGELFLRVYGYEPCQNEEEVLSASDYDPQSDMDNPVDSIFCAHGAGFVVPWNQVSEYMHMESPLSFGEEELKASSATAHQAPAFTDAYIDEEELEAIFKRTFGANVNQKKRETGQKERRFRRTEHGIVQSGNTVNKSYKRPVLKDKYLLVDGYNIIFAWEQLNHLSKDNLGGARNRLLDIMCNYQAYRRMNLIVVFDAYKVEGNVGECFDYHNIHVVYTREAQTADAYIEQFTHRMGKKYDITVATSDALEQMIVLGQGAKRISARELLENVHAMEQELREQYLDREWD